MLPQIERNAQAPATRIEQEWTSWLQASLFTANMSVRTVVAVCGRLQVWLADQMKSAQKALVEHERQQTRLEQTVIQAETAVSKATASFFMGRNGRIRDTLAYYFRAAEGLVDAQLQGQLIRARITTWHGLHQWVSGKVNEMSALEERLVVSAAHIGKEADRQTEKIAQGGIASISLADETYMRTLYSRYQPKWADIKDRLGDPLLLCHLTTEKLTHHLVDALSPHFDLIAAMGVEEVIQARADEMSPRARRQQLFQLATPSWNVDRARLPEGGANLVRLEVLGVPDATDSLFAGEPMLVSTFDRRRLTALVVAAGAPPAALQQYDHYLHAMDQVQGK
ncbi:MAG: hypothetical protein ACE5FD_18105, partial [Anaerolineae bacterium]